jgi:hypothetical protein
LIVRRLQAGDDLAILHPKGEEKCGQARSQWVALWR